MRPPVTMAKEADQAATGRLRVIIVDDHRMVIDGIRAILDQEAMFEIVGDASNGREAVARAKELQPDVVIMDISMPEMDGIEATRAITATDKKVKNVPAVLALSMYGTKEMVDEMIGAGASGYVLKNTGRDELREAILAVSRGERYFASEVHGLLDKAYGTDGPGSSHKPVVLSRREKQVVTLLAMDKTIAQIADALFLSPSTVETHRKNVYHKLGIHSSTALVKYAMERGWTNGTESE